MSEQRASDPELCRRIAQARGWKEFGWESDEKCWTALTPDGEVRYVPEWDTDAAACLELMTALFDDGWIITHADAVPDMVSTYRCLMDKPGHNEAAGLGGWFEQAFAQAAAAALEASK